MTFETVKAGWLEEKTKSGWQRNWYVLYANGQLRVFESPEQVINTGPEGAQKSLLVCAQTLRIFKGAQYPSDPSFLPPEERSIDCIVVMDKGAKKKVYCAENAGEAAVWQFALEQALSVASSNRIPTASAAVAVAVAGETPTPPPYTAPSAPPAPAPAPATAPEQSNTTTESSELKDREGYRVVVVEGRPVYHCIEHGRCECDHCNSRFGSSAEAGFAVGAALGAVGGFLLRPLGWLFGPPGRGHHHHHHHGGHGGFGPRGGFGHGHGGRH